MRCFLGVGRSAATSERELFWPLSDCLANATERIMYPTAFSGQAVISAAKWGYMLAFCHAGDHCNSTYPSNRANRTNRFSPGASLLKGVRSVRTQGTAVWFSWFSVARHESCFLLHRFCARRGVLERTRSKACSHHEDGSHRQGDRLTMVFLAVGNDDADLGMDRRLVFTPGQLGNRRQRKAHNWSKGKS
jgi:hypothetical protein